MNAHDHLTHVLLAEDSATQAEQLRFFLEEQNYQVRLARNGRAALELARAQTPDIVISDIVMPEMDGYELCRSIKTDPDLKETPVMLLTSLSDPVDVVRGLECGADSFVVKPYQEKHLLSRMAFLMANRHARESENAQLGVEIIFAGKKYFITSERIQILNLLLSTYETAVQRNQELLKTQRELKALTASLEDKVRERTAALAAEVAERKQAEQAVRRLNDELEQRVRQRTEELESANKELEAFSYSVSHDLRAPLRAISGFARILLDRPADQIPADMQRPLNHIEKGAEKLSQMVEALLSFSRFSRQLLRSEPVHMSVLARDCLRELQSEQTGRKIRLELQELPPCTGDPLLLKQVLFNLISNALKYTRKREEAAVTIGWQRNGDGETIYFVRDNGVGFDMKYSHRLFAVFQRLHRAEDYEGNGAGLAIVQRIVLRHGGRIWVEAAPDQGACFFFSIGTQKTV